MRFGLLALSIAMLGSGGFAAQSALAISSDATAKVAATPHLEHKEVGPRNGSLQFAGNHEHTLRLAMR